MVSTPGSVDKVTLPLQNQTMARWWQLKYFLFSTLFGEDSHFDEHIYILQTGWFNHQLDGFVSGSGHSHNNRWVAFPGICFF